MYFKDNSKSGKSGWFGDGHSFSYYEFSRLQQWLEVGQRLQRIYSLYTEIDSLLKELNSKHGPILQERYNRVTGYTTGIAKPIKNFVDSDRIRYISRLIEELFNRDLKLILTVSNEIRELRSYKNLAKSIKMYGDENNTSRETIEKHFGYLTLDSLRHNLVEFWDEVRKQLDDKTNEIIIPEPTMENREFFSYFLQSRDCYCEKNQEIALAIIRKAIEDILTRLWILYFDNLQDIDFNQRPNLDNLPGFLKSKGILEEQEFREAQPLIKYGNAGIHIKGEIPKKRLFEKCGLMINTGINFVNNLCRKYIELMQDKGYCSIQFTKTGFSIKKGNL